VKKLVIDRNRWLRGHEGSSALLVRVMDEDPQMCCLGFHALACGLTEDDIENKAYPSVLGDYPERWLLEEQDSWVPESGVVNVKLWDRVIALMNDANGVDDPTREAWLTEGFRALGGIEVEFVDGPVSP
jgi:hypothetical protein